MTVAAECTCAHPVGLHGRVGCMHWGPDQQFCPCKVQGPWRGEGRDQVHSGAPAGAVDAPGRVHPGSGRLKPGDLEYLHLVREYVAECTRVHRTPSVRALKTRAGVGQERAKRLIRYVKEEDP